MSFQASRKHEMANDEVREVALLYSLGLLEQELASGFRQHLESGCPVCESELRGFNEVAAQVADSLPQAKPHPRLRQELLNRIGREGSRATIFRAHDGEWQTSPFAGVSLKQLYVDPTTGYVTSLVRMTPGAVYPPHHHAGLEHCYVLEGDLVFHDHTLHSGDYEVAISASDHSSVTTKSGCLLLIINNQRDQLLAQ